jgi:hypothetical protein
MNIKSVNCFFCNADIIPEETGSDYDGWLFECDCGAIWESRGRTIPRIRIVNRPDVRVELNFDDD